MRPVGHQRPDFRLSAAADAIVLELPDAAAVGAGDRAAFAQAKGAVRNEPELPAAVIAVLRAKRGQLVGHARVGIRPLDALAILREFEGVADAGAIGLVHATSDLGADGCADDGADHDGHVALGAALGDLAGDCAACHSTDDAPEHLADAVAIARAGAHAIVVV